MRSRIARAVQACAGGLSVCLLLLSCTNEPLQTAHTDTRVVEVAEPQNLVFASAPPRDNPYRMVGELHNKAMAWVLADLQAARTRLGNGWNAAALRREVDRSLDTFAVAHRSVIDPAIFAQMRARAKDRAGQRFRAASMLSTTASPSSAMNLSVQADGMIAELLDIPDRNESLSASLSSIAVVEDSAVARLDTTEQEIVLSLASVLSNSLVYWEATGSEWDQLCEPPEGYPSGGHNPCQEWETFAPGGAGGMTLVSASVVRRGWFNWRKVGKMDIAGGIAGMLFGPSGIGPGAIAGSVFEAAAQILDRWFPDPEETWFASPQRSRNAPLFSFGL